jgi:ABC-type multidrug transport system permease subunit
MLPLIHLTASDLSGSILKRGLACGRRHRRFFLARVLAGAIFILMVLLMIFPTSGLLDLADRFIGRAYGGNLLALVLTILLTSLCLSALAAALAVWTGKVQAAVWIGFYLVLGMAATGGALIPEQSLPAWLAATGACLPLRSALRSLACALFRFDPALYWPDTAKLLLLTGVFLLLGLWGFARRERG